MSYTKSQIEEFARKLKELPAVEKTTLINKLEAVKALKPEILSMQKKGYTIEKISEALTSFGLEITTPTLKAYMQKASTKKNKKIKGVELKVEAEQKLSS